MHEQVWNECLLGGFFSLEQNNDNYLTSNDPPGGAIGVERLYPEWPALLVTGLRATGLPDLPAAAS